MHKLIRTNYKFALLFNIILMIGLMTSPKQAEAQWPPFQFRLTPTPEAGKIRYDLTVSDRVDWTITDLDIHIPLPEGTRFVEASAQETMEVIFDGQEIRFFASVLHRPIRNAHFVVEVIEPSKTEYTTQAWISWKGDNPGDFLTDNILADTTKRPLNWSRPPRSRLQLEAKAIVTDKVITYKLYPYNFSATRMWDLTIKLPIPEGTTLLSIDALPPFEAKFDGQEATFFALELPLRVQVEPLVVTVSTEGVTAPQLVTHAWATWKNASKSAGKTIDAQEQKITGDIVVEPHTSQEVIADMIGDVPFSNYDLTSIILQNEGDALKATFYTTGNICPTDIPLEYRFYIDTDCNTDTGFYRQGRGAEYEIRYDYRRDRGSIRSWSEETEEWVQFDRINGESTLGGNSTTIRIPYALIEGQQAFCWVARARNNIQGFTPSQPTDWLPRDDSEFRLSEYDATQLSIIPVTKLTPKNIETDSAACLAQPEVTNTSLRIQDISGKLAVPLLNDGGLYDVHVFSIPDGQEIVKINNARQPNLRFDGQKMLINREGGGVEDIYEYNFTDGVQQKVSNAPRDSHPSYDSFGNRVAYGNPELTVGAKGGIRKPFIFIQCSLLPPYQETDARCKNISTFGVLVPAGHIGEIEGTHPVWTAFDQIVYKGCNTWVGARRCGLYVVPATSTKGSSNGFLPTLLVDDISAIPSDTQWGLLTFTSRRDEDWEAYVVNLDKSGLRNLSNSPTSNDGLPTISPDGQWAAFISDRGGSWAVWATPIAGGETYKLFELPDGTSWGVGEYDWMNERISWGE